MLKVISSLAIKAAYVELVPQFEKQSGHQVASADDGLGIAPGQALREGISAVIERRHLIDAERAIPDDRRRAVAGL